MHPPYQPGHQGHALRVLSYPAPLDEQGYRRFNKVLVETVMDHGLI